GTGKSYVTRLIVNDLISKRKKFLLMAPTGIAAQNIGGQTIHSTLRIQESNSGYKTLAFSDTQFFKQLQKIDILIIEEISMVSALLFTFISEMFAKIHENTIAFGGLSVIAVGDLAQLPPASGLPVYKSSVWKLFYPLFLRQPQRQNQDFLYYKALEDIRFGNITQKTHNFLLQKFNESHQQKTLEETLNTTYIVGYRETAARFNRMICNMLPVENDKFWICDAIDTIDGKQMDLTDTMQKILTIKEKSNRGCCLEVKLSIPKELHPKFRDYPMCPEQMKQKEWIGKQRPDTEKLIVTLHDKDHYVIHYRNLQQCIREGYVLEKVYRVLGFEQSPWMEPYIAMNTQRRAKAKNAFEKDFWKLMNNSVFGKTMEDVRKRVNIDLVRQVGEEHRLRRLISDPAFVSRKIFYGANLVAVHRRQTNVKLNKPEYVGSCILDLSKYYMYDFWYSYLKKKYGDKVKLLYTDTDSLIIEIETENIYQDMINDCDLFDFSDYPKEHWVVKNLPEDQWIINEEGKRVLKNTKVIGKWKDENGGDRAIGYAGVRAKCYSDCVLEGKEDQPRTAQFLRSYRHRMYRISQTKRSVNPLDTKLWIAQDMETTYLYGDCEIPEE
ncbi:3672_t:CDS:2, partial [Entrophospora sp. SA101]